ncbi:MAG TPA: MFS transporter [Thermoplasmata archaeon]|nr:MFS transporter [Thermoplasmata archaeon]
MEFKSKTLAVVCVGSLMGAIDSTVLIIAFPAIARDLSASLAEMVWAIMIYTLMGTALVLSLGRVADMKGRKRMYNAGFVVFILGSALCGLAPDGLSLVVFRGVQGIGGALLVANSFAILSDVFPPNERGRAFGVISVVWGAGSVLGIGLGGLILSFASWRWIFWINVPIGVAATGLAFLILRESVTPNPKDTFDIPAAVLFTAGLAALLLGITEGILNGWTAPITIDPLLGAVPLLVAFLLWEGYVSRDPILPFDLFRSWLFSASLISSVLQGIALFATNFLLMVYFQGIRGVPVLTAAFLLIPLSATLSVFGPVGGRLSDRYGARVVSTIGLVIQGAVLFAFSTLEATTSLWVVAGYEAALGVGGGLFFPANTSAVMSGVPRPRYGVASGVMMTLRNSSMALSFAVGLIALTASLPAGTAAAIFGGTFSPQMQASLGLSNAALSAVFIGGMRTVFRLAAVLVLASALFSALRGREYRAGAATTGRVRSVREPIRAVAADSLAGAPSAGRSLSDR